MKNSIKCLGLFCACLLGLALTTQAQIGATVALTGTVLDELTRQPVTVTINVNDETGKKVNSTRSNEKEGGVYYVILKPGTKYSFQFEHPNYFREEYSVETPRTTKYAELTRDWLVRPMKEGAKMQLAVSPFEYKKSKMRGGAEELLSHLRAAMVMNPSVKFEIQCYPDLAENKDANMKLTQDRATSLRDYFVKAGVSPDRIVIRAAAEIDPLNPMPLRKGAKGRRYVGSTYIAISKV